MPKDHPLKYKVVGEGSNRRLVCATCGKGIEGARTDFTGKWRGGVHEGDTRGIEA